MVIVKFGLVVLLVSFAFSSGAKDFDSCDNLIEKGKGQKLANGNLVERAVSMAVFGEKLCNFDVQDIYPKILTNIKARGCLESSPLYVNSAKFIEEHRNATPDKLIIFDSPRLSPAREKKFLEKVLKDMGGCSAVSEKLVTVRSGRLGK